MAQEDFPRNSSFLTNNPFFQQSWEERLASYELAAESGNYYAQVLLGDCYFMGNGVPKDIKKAVRFYQQAANQKYAPAECRIAWCFEYGQGLPQSFQTAYLWYQTAAKHGEVRAQHWLAYQQHRDAEERMDTYPSPFSPTPQ